MKKKYMVCRIEEIEREDTIRFVECDSFKNQENAEAHIEALLEIFGSDRFTIVITYVKQK